MSVNRWTVLAALLALCLLPLFTGVASALRDLRFSERTIDLLEELRIEGNPLRIVCQTELVLRLTNQLVPKREGDTVGEATGTVLGQQTSMERCSSGRAHFLGAGRPLIYRDFGGTLPNITFVDFEIPEIELLVTAPLGVFACLIRANMIIRKEISRGILGRGTVLSFTANNVFQLSGMCPEEHEFSASGGLAYIGPARTVIVELV